TSPDGFYYAVTLWSNFTVRSGQLQFNCANFLAPTEYFFAAFLVPPPALAQCALPSLRFSSNARLRVCAQALPHHHTPCMSASLRSQPCMGSNNDDLRAPRCKRVAVWQQTARFPFSFKAYPRNQEFDYLIAVALVAKG